MVAVARAYRGRGSFFEEDEDSDLTIDFGVFRPLSIGNRVWFDTGNGTPANNNNGTLDIGELGVDSVDISLFF